MQYKHLFFDWDHTLWDFEENSRLALEKLYYEFDLRQLGIQSPQHFIDVYNPINAQMWLAFQEGKIDSKTVKIQRFKDTLKRFGVVTDDLVAKVKLFYLNELPKGGLLLPNVKETLEALKNEYKLHVVTNGFREVSIIKIEQSGLAPYFTSILSAADVGVQKPNAKVFETALANNSASKNESLFIGDNQVADVQGAQNFGIDQVFYNYHKVQHELKPTYEITNMLELVELLGKKQLA